MYPVHKAHFTRVHTERKIAPYVTLKAHPDRSSNSTTNKVQNFFLRFCLVCCSTKITPHRSSVDQLENQIYPKP